MEKSSEENFFYAFPAPSGKYAIGKVSFSLVDPNRKEWHVKNSDAPRELMVHVWYPSQKSQGSEYKKLDTKSDYYLKMKTLCQKDMHFNEDQCHQCLNIITYAIPKANIASDGNSFPVIIFSPGFEEPSEAYTILLEQLASCGYIVIGIDHPYFCQITSFPDGRVLKGGFDDYLKNSDKKNRDYRQVNDYFVHELQTNVADILFVIDTLINPIDNPLGQKLFDRMDFANMGMMGHSCGGACAVEVCRRDSRIKVAINFDGAFFGAFSIDGVKKPIMTLFTEKFLMQKTQSTEQEASMLGLSSAAMNQWYDGLMEERFAFCKNMGEFGTEVILKNFAHQSVLNHVLLKNEVVQHLVFGNDVEKQVGTIQPEKAITISNDFIQAFFDKHLKKLQNLEFNQGRLHGGDVIFVNKTTLGRD